MEWEKLVEMIKYYNQSKHEEARKIIDFDTITLQGLDMIITAEELTESNISKNREFFKKLIDKCEEVFNGDNISSRTGLRFEYLKLFYNEIESNK